MFPRAKLANDASIKTSNTADNAASTVGLKALQQDAPIKGAGANHFVQARQQTLGSSLSGDESSMIRQNVGNGGFQRILLLGPPVKETERPGACQVYLLTTDEQMVKISCNRLSLKSV